MTIPLTLIEGPVGAGKSTYALTLAHEHQGVHLNLDEWMVNLFAKDRPDDNFISWYAECKARLIEQIWLVAQSLLAVDTPVILELGLVSRAERLRFYTQVALDQPDQVLDVHILEPSREIRAERVKKRNAVGQGTYTMLVSEEVFALADSAWESPEADEIAEHNLVFL